MKLLERPGINIYTSVETLKEDTDEWALIRESAQGHGGGMGEAEARVAALLAGGWRSYFPDLAPAEVTPWEILRKPYARTFLLNDNGIFTALILEFPGCIAEGSSLNNAYSKLDDAAHSWITAMQANGNPIPEPFESDTTSVGNLQKLWTAVDKWRQDFPVASAEELSRAVLKIVTPRKL